MSDVDWWAPLGATGRLEVRELLSPDVWGRYFAADPEGSFELATFTLLGVELGVSARRSARSVTCDGRPVAELDFSAAADPGHGWAKPLTMLGMQGMAARRADEARGSRVRGPLQHLRVTCGDRRWVWHFEGGRAAGERLVLARADVPREAPPLVTTYPAGQGRALGNPRGGATRDTHVTSWMPHASAADVVLAELLATARLDGLVDYRPARLASGLSELLDLTPGAEANTD